MSPKYLSQEFELALRYNPAQAAEYLHISPATLEAWRVQNRGPAFLKVGGRVQYLKSDLDAFLRSRRRETRTSRQIDPQHALPEN